MKFRIHRESDKESLKTYIDRLNCEKEYEVTVTQKKKHRSLSQNALYHMWLNCVAKETGNAIEDIAEEFKRMFLGYRVVEVFGEERQILKSTATLTKDEFTAFMSQMQMFCEVELGIVLPNPDDRFIEQFEEQYGNT